ncbi:MAG: hypothetical protein ACJ764_15350 [Solirubrobacteraceae bacterium]
MGVPNAIRGTAAALVACAIAFVLVTAASARVPQYGPPVPANPFKHPHRYINPFKNSAWGPARTDMGVDWIPAHKLPVLAIGDAVILGSDSHAHWEGHHIIWYQLLDGSHAGDIIYVAEHLRKLLPAGRFVRAGQRIATALPGYPWTEWGWATSYGSPVAYPCYDVDGKQTRAGKEMARFMMSLGAHVYNRPGRGPRAPQGGRCA